METISFDEAYTIYNNLGSNNCNNCDFCCGHFIRANSSNARWSIYQSLQTHEVGVLMDRQEACCSNKVEDSDISPNVNMVKDILPDFVNEIKSNPVTHSLPALIKFYKSELNPAKYKWNVKKNKDKHSEMIEVTVLNRASEKQVLYLAGSKANGANQYSLTVNFFADNL